MSETVAAKVVLYAMCTINVAGRIFHAGDVLKDVGPGAIESMLRNGQASPTPPDVSPPPPPRRPARKAPPPADETPQAPNGADEGGSSDEGTDTPEGEVPIGELQLSPAAAKVLAKLEIASIEQLEAKLEEHSDLTHLEGIGEKLADEITKALEAFYAN
jgi:hypothetical protein